MKNFINLIFIMGLLSACSHEVDVTYNCVPSGATVYEEGVGLIGTCPLTVKYSPYDVKIDDGKLYTDKVKVVWLSGASVFAGPVTWAIPDDHKIALTFLHPANTLDYERDERFGVAYDKNLTAPEERYLVSVHQDKSIFDAFNSNFTCALDGLTQNVNAQCP